jgi:hypothetical protein
MLARIKFCNFGFSKWQREAMLAWIYGTPVRFQRDSVAITSLENLIYMVSHYYIVSKITLLDSNDTQSIKYFCSRLFPNILDIKNDFVVVLLQIFWNDDISWCKPCALLQFERLVGFVKRQILEVANYSGGYRGQSNNNGSANDRIVKGALCLLFGICLVIFSIFYGTYRYYASNYSANDFTKEARRFVWFVLLLVFGWGMIVYGGVLLLPAVKELTAPYRRSEDVSVLPIVIAELKFSDIQRQIFVTDLVEAPHDAALNQRPKSLNCVGMNDSSNTVLTAHTVSCMLASTVIDGLMIVFASNPTIAAKIVGAEQADPIRNGFNN